MIRGLERNIYLACFSMPGCVVDRFLRHAVKVSRSLLVAIGHSVPSLERAVNSLQLSD